MQVNNLVFYPSAMLRSFWSICLALFLLFTSKLLWLQPNTTVSALGNETDRMALLKFKDSIFEDPFEVVTSWNESSHFCNWHGVTCSHRHQRVTELNLAGYLLQGFITPHIGNLSFLRILNLASNNFYGQIPQEMGHLFRLQILYLTNNTLEGKFPIMLTNCSELKNLSLVGNHLIGQIQEKIGTLRKLEVLQVSKNNLTGQIPPSIGNLSTLIVLSTTYNNLEGNIPKEIGQLKHLTTLFVAVNNLSGMLPSSLYNLSSLINFEITYNQFNGHLPTNLFLTLPNLKVIGGHGNQFSGPIPTSITNASRIQLFDLGDNHFVGKVPSFGNHKGLSLLTLEFNVLGSNSSDDWDFLKSLINCSQLNELYLGYNNLGGHLPKFIGNLSAKLSHLTLYDNRIFGKIPTELGNLLDLFELDLDSNYVTDVIPASFGKLQNLQSLTLASNKLSGELPASIGNLSKLLELDLSSNMLIGKIPSTLGNCKNLLSLDLSLNYLHGALPSQLIGLSSLSSLLNISHNSLNGSLPIEVGMLKNVEALDLSENYLYGKIPKTIGACISLEYLYLQGNSLDGIIPPSLASLKGLQKLDLSQNNLSGSIPQELQNISVLQYFNVSFNMLEGEVPTNGIFRNASAFSFISNGKLCGGVLQLKLPPCPLKTLKHRKHQNLRLIVVVICSTIILLLLSCFLAIYLRRNRQRKASIESTIDPLPKVSYQNLHHATDGFSTRNLIGAGSLGSVYKGSLDSLGGVVAIKVLNLEMKGAHKSFFAECNALRNIRHRNLAKIFTCCSSMDYNGNEFKALVFEYMSNGSLEEWLHPEKECVEQPRALNIKKRLEIVVDIASALHYLQYECEQPIIHCDLKPTNVLLDDDMVAHVSDFGLARLLAQFDGNSYKQTSTIGIKGTMGYAPPEYGMGSPISIEGDMYSFGILLLEMFTGKRPTEEMFKDGHNLHNYVKIALPGNILEIIDAMLLRIENEHPKVTPEGSNISEITPYLHPNAEKCLLALFNIGLSCSTETAKERMNMKEVTNELNMIREAFSN